MSIGPEPVPLDDYFESRRIVVDESLERWLPGESDVPPALARAMRHAVFPGGKRLRPILVLAACQACGGDESAALPAAAAVEMVHCYSLVHDDLPAMDDDDVRRGRPTCHRVFGEALAILAGDALLTLAFETLARHSGTAQLAAAGCRELAAAIGAGGMVGGQADDVAQADTAQDSAKQARDRLKQIHDRKTGALFRACLRLGGHAAAAEPETIETLDRFGERIGLAFQIADDLLDVCGAEQAAGKRVGKDGSRGKLTYPRIIGIESSRRLARELVQQGCALLRPLGPSARRLEELARFIVERDR